MCTNMAAGKDDGKTGAWLCSVWADEWHREGVAVSVYGCARCPQAQSQLSGDTLWKE